MPMHEAWYYWQEYDARVTEIRAICNVSEAQVFEKIQASPFEAMTALFLLREQAIRGEWPEQAEEVSK